MSTSHLLLAQSATLIGAHLDIEHRLFATFGRASLTSNDDAVTVALSRTSLLHGQRAHALEDRLPLAQAFNRADFVAPYSQAVVDLFVALDHLIDIEPDAAGSIIVTVAARDLLSLLTSTYRFHLEHTTVHSDGPIRRLLTAAITELGREHDEFDALDRRLNCAVPEEIEGILRVLRAPQRFCVLSIEGQS